MKYRVVFSENAPHLYANGTQKVKVYETDKGYYYASYVDVELIGEETMLFPCKFENGEIKEVSTEDVWSCGYDAVTNDEAIKEYLEETYGR